MGGLLFLGLIAWLIWYFGRNNNKVGNPEDLNLSLDKKTLRRDRSWLLFLKKQHQATSSKAEKRFIEKLFSQLKSQNIEIPEDLSLGALTITNPEEVEAVAVSQVTLSEQHQNMSTALGVETPAIQVVQPTPPKAQVQLDNANMLLYFGAFLFVASAGLFVAFSGMSGGVRTLTVLLVSLCMYGAGVWLFKNKHKFAQAGLAFAGIGISIAPLVGLAAYVYVYDQTNGASVWLTTSALCMTLYIHALVTLRKPLINYIFIFTLVSFFQSMVSIIDAPVYYYGWVFSIIGIGLAAVNQVVKFWSDFEESSKLSSQLFVPLSLLLSLTFLPESGAIQFGVSVLLGACFYGLQYVTEKRDSDKTNYALVTHILVLCGITSLAYGWTESLSQAMTVLSIAGLLQAVIVAVSGGVSERQKNFATILVLGQIIATVFSYENSKLMLLHATFLTLIAALVWIRQSRTDGYVLLIVGLFSLPLIWGQLVVDNQFAPSLQILLTFGPLTFQAATLLNIQSMKKGMPDLESVALQTYALSIGVIAVFSMLAKPYEALFFNVLIVLVSVMIAEGIRKKQLVTYSSAALFLPLFFGYTDDVLFFALATAIGAILHVILAVRYREEFNRWSATLLWLLLPIGLGHAELFGVWGVNAYGWMYLLVGLGLVLSRAIARGVVFRSEKVSLASMEKQASLSYLIGYILAFSAVVVMVFNTEVSVLEGTMMSIALLPIFWVIGSKVEKDDRYAVALPLLSQLVLWSVLRPTLRTEDLTTYLLMTSTLGVLWYLAIRSSAVIKGVLSQSLKMSAVATTMIAPLAYFAASELSIAMPVGAIILSAILYDIYRSTTQANREWVIGVSLGSVWWLLWYFGIKEVQVYAHTLTFLLVGYAYWRYQRAEKQTSESYITAALFSATVPLFLQSLSETNGALYGWWLLLEQVGIILIGMGINNRLMIRWGLYASLGAVLYQLRDLGWAALTVLALFIIAVAVRKIQKYGDHS